MCMCICSFTYKKCILFKNHRSIGIEVLYLPFRFLVTLILDFIVPNSDMLKWFIFIFICE